jgi:hypothetical protein
VAVDYSIVSLNKVLDRRTSLRIYDLLDCDRPQGIFPVGLRLLSEIANSKQPGSIPYCLLGCLGYLLENLPGSRHHLRPLELRRLSYIRSWPFRGMIVELWLWQTRRGVYCMLMKTRRDGSARDPRKVGKVNLTVPF